MHCLSCQVTSRSQPIKYAILPHIGIGQSTMIVTRQFGGLMHNRTTPIPKLFNEWVVWSWKLNLRSDISNSPHPHSSLTKSSSIPLNRDASRVPWFTKPMTIHSTEVQFEGLLPKAGRQGSYNCLSLEVLHRICPPHAAAIAAEWRHGNSPQSSARPLWGSESLAVFMLRTLISSDEFTSQTLKSSGSGILRHVL